MSDTSDVRRRNANAIRRLLWAGGCITKQEAARMLGLSVATCNTLLNEMAASGEVLAEPLRVSTVGRSSQGYRANEDHATVACVSADIDAVDKRVVQLGLLSVTGTVLEQRTATMERLQPADLVQLVADFCEPFGNVAQVVIGVPGIAREGVVNHCDIAELDGAELVAAVGETVGAHVHMENDMHLKAYGYFCEQGDPQNVVTLVNFPAHVLPGTATVHAGSVIHGAHEFAGMAGFLPFGPDGAILTPDEVRGLLVPETCRPVVSRSVASIIALLNPHEVVFTGDLLEPGCIDWIRDDCRRTIPEEFMPRLRYELNFDGYYLGGMYHAALDKMEARL